MILKKKQQQHLSVLQKRPKKQTKQKKKIR